MSGAQNHKTAVKMNWTGADLHELLTVSLGGVSRVAYSLAQEL